MAIIQKGVEGVCQPVESRIRNLIRNLQNYQDQALQDRFCTYIVEGLGIEEVPRDSQNDMAKYKAFIKDVYHVQEFLTEKCSKNEVKLVALRTLYKQISESEKPPSPAMSIVLQLFDVDYIRSAVSDILKLNNSNESLERSLFTLCNWLTRWTFTDNLGPLVLAFMDGLREQHPDIVLEVTNYYIKPLFNLLILPELRKSVSPVVFYMLSTVDHNGPEVFHKIIPIISNVVKFLDKEKSNSSLNCLRNIINVCVALMDDYPGYPSLYEPLKRDLESYSDFKQALGRKTWSDGGNLAITSYSSVGKVGLNNLGNTCYMNSVLQALFMTKPFRNEVLLNTEDVMPLFSKLQVLFTLLQFSPKFSLSPSDILNLARPPGFLPGHQHDSSEFLGYLLDVLHEQEKGASGSSNAGHSGESADPAMNTIVQTAFGGRTVSFSTCGECGTKSERIDNFRELQLSFPTNSVNQSVQTLLDYYLQPEKLSGDNQYHCDACGLTDGERVTQIDEAPPRLILTLKHFRYDPASQQRTKLLQSIKLDEHVHLIGAQYDLYAAVVHWGTSVDSGHYYTFSKERSEWFKFNDCSVMKTTSEELYSLKPPETPYILFYARRDCVDPEDLPQSCLCQRLQLAISKDNSEFEAETRKRPFKSYNTNNSRFNRDDEPPPPGCGGGGFSSISSNMYVC